MEQGYRRRFVVINLASIAVVLLIAFIGLDLFMARSAADQLQEAMTQAVLPWDSPSGSFRLLDDRRPGEDNFGKRPEGEPPERPEEDFRPGRLEQETFEGILTAFYNRETGELSILSSDETADPGRLSAAVAEIAELSENHGTLKEYKLIYYKEGIGESLKLALADTSYLTGKILRNTLLLGLIFLGAMGVFFGVSVWLSGLAAKPMEDAIEMERQFVADISHDLKTPITVILANNSILRASPEATVGEQRQWLGSTETAAKNMMEMIDEMLTLSALESTGKQTVLSRVDLSAAAEKAVLQLESVAYDRGVTVDSELEEDLFIQGTPEYAARITGGLLENALKYEPDGGHVQVTLARQKKKAVYTVQNAGSVIDPADLPHLFERFYRGDKARSSQQGHGLGLPIIRQMTELMGGVITVESSPEAGTLFRVELDTE